MKRTGPSGLNRSLSSLFLLLVLVLILILAASLRHEKALLDRELMPMASKWQSIVESKQLERVFGLTFVRDSRIFSRRFYEYLYPRRYVAEALSREVTRFLSDRGIGIRKTSLGKLSRDITIVLGSEEVPYAKLVCTPDMSTYAGKICLIIDDFGYNLNSVVKEFLDLEVPTTFSILPGHPFSKDVATLAYEAGHEVMLHMPMESKDHRAGEDDFVLKRGLTSTEIRSRLRNALRQIPQAVGISNHQGSLATESRKVMRIVAEVLRSERKYFVDSRTSPQSVGVEEMQRADVPVSERTVFIDYQDDRELVEKQVKLLERKAREDGIAIGIGHPRKNTLGVLREQIARLEQEGFDFVYPSSIVQ